MRILMAAPLLPHPAATTGGALVFFGLIEALAHRHEVTLVCFGGASATDREGLDALARLGVTVHVVWREPGRTADVVRRRASLAARWLASRDPLRALKFHDARVQAALDRAVHDGAARGLPFDLVQVEDSAMGQYRYPGGIPSVFTEHEVRVADQSSWLEAARWARYQRTVWRCFDRVQVFTERDAAGLRHLAPDLAGRVRVNPFGVALGTAPGAGTEREDELVFVGGFRHPPNVDAAIWLAREILPLVHARRAGAHLTIVGADPPRAVRGLASDCVTVTGFVPDVEPFLARAAVVVAPLRTGSGMRVKLLQALARGKAVVSTSLGAEGLAADAPLLVAGSASELAEAVAGLLADETKRHALARRAREYVAEHHTWSGFASRLAATYRELGLEA
jgi:glycosyltransferase involved in cell wall biosynthesis